MTKRIVVITGATSGIGLAVATLLLEQGFDLFGVGSSSRTLEIEAALSQRFPERLIRYFRADLSVLANVRILGEQIIQAMTEVGETQLFALINNAGGVVSRYRLTSENIEYQFALNHLSTLVLTRTLLDPLQNGMVLFTGSNSHHHAKIHWRNLFYKGFYWIFGPYRQSKLANLMTAKKFNEILHPLGIDSYVVDPGLVKTSIGTRSMHGPGRWAWLFVSRKGISPEDRGLDVFPYHPNATSNRIVFLEFAAKQVSSNRKRHERSQSIVRSLLSNGECFVSKHRIKSLKIVI
jgi:NAD(P)-dependent dehydrogenase (short-subunit alcohol dehydrogenase family)